MKAFVGEAVDGSVSPGYKQMSADVCCSEPERHAYPESDTELEDINHVSLKDSCTGGCGSDAQDDLSSDFGECVNSDLFCSTDIVTSAAATWCVHAVYQAPDADPLVSFFSQLVSSHRVVKNLDERQTEQTAAQPSDDRRETIHISHQEGHSGEIAQKNSVPRIVVDDYFESPYDASDDNRGFEETIVGNPVAFEGKGRSGSDPDMREYLAASLKRSNFVNILGSLRLAIRHNPHIFGVFDSQQPNYDTMSKRPCEDLQESILADQWSNKRGQPNVETESDVPPVDTRCRATGQSAKMPITGQAFLPPPVPVNLEFCRVNPRTAVAWLVYSQVAATEEGHRMPYAQAGENKTQAEGQRRLDADTEAQLACLVPPDCLPDHASASGETAVPVVNPLRDALGKVAAKLVASLDADGVQALTELLHSWYYSGFFTGQRFGICKGTNN